MSFWGFVLGPSGYPRGGCSCGRVPHAAWPEAPHHASNSNIAYGAAATLYAGANGNLDASILCVTTDLDFGSYFQHDLGRFPAVATKEGPLVPAQLTWCPQPAWQPPRQPGPAAAGASLAARARPRGARGPPRRPQARRPAPWLPGTAGCSPAAAAAAPAGSGHEQRGPINQVTRFTAGQKGGASKAVTGFEAAHSREGKASSTF